MNAVLTVFTSTYNRAYCLHYLYESLCRQTSQEFVWLVIDDGSTDETKRKIETWQLEKKIDINYFYKENGGMHTGHNAAYEKITTPYNICIDSDDFMPDDAVEKILLALLDIPEDTAGLVGLDADKNTGAIIGTTIPDKLTAVKLNELYSLHGVKGDKKLVYRTAIVKQYPKYPLYEKERFVPLDYLYLLIDQDYSLKPVNEIFCIVEYQEDGSSRNILKQYRSNPNGFAFSRISRIKYGKTFQERYKNAIHLVSSSCFASSFRWIKKTDKPFLVMLASPIGVLLYLYIRFKTKK